MSRPKNTARELNSLPILRHDFTEATHCAICPEPPQRLKLGVATFLLNEEGEEIPVGPVCAKRWGMPRENIPDLVSGLIDYSRDAEEASERSLGNNAREKRGSGKDARYQKAAEYLWFRCGTMEKLGFRLPSSMPWMVRVYESAKTQSLNEAQVTRVTNLMNKSEDWQNASPSEKGFYRSISYSTLKPAYICAVAIDRCQKSAKLNSGATNFLTNIREALVKDLYLSPKQIEAIAKCEWAADSPILLDKVVFPPKIWSNQNKGQGR